MRWPIDDSRELDPASRPLSPPFGELVRARLVAERRIARSFGFPCFAEYYADRRARGWGLDRMARETGQTRDWVRGVVRRYGSPEMPPVQPATGY